MVMVFLLLSAGEVNQDVPLWKKLSYGIGYSGGLCWRGKDLMPYCPYMFCWEWPFYYLHSIELSAIYPFGNGEGIEVGVGYGWARIEDAKGWFKVVYLPDDTMRLHGWFSANLHSFTITVSPWNDEVFLKPFLSLCGVLAKGSENRGSLWFPVNRVSIGLEAGITGFYKFRLSRVIITPFLSFTFSYLREVWNDSPWNEYWEKTLSVSLSGLYGGIKINFGGVR